MTLIEGVSSTILTSGGLNLGQLVRPRLSLTLKQSKRRKTTTLLTVSPPASVVFSVRRPNETSTDDDCLGPHSVSSGFSRLLRKKTDRNPPRVMTLSVLTASLPDWRISVLMASIPSSPSERRLKQPRKLTLSVLTASISSYLFFSVRKLIETTTEIDSLGPHHGINSVFSLLLCQKTDLFNFEITSQVVNVWNFGSVFLVCILAPSCINGEEWLLFTHHLNPSLAELNSSFLYHASSPTLPLKLETEYREGPSLENRKSPLYCHNILSTLFGACCGLLHRMLAIGFISPLSQHLLYPLWSRLWTSPQNVGNRLHLSIVTTSSLPSLEQAVDFSTECWQ
ncbi:hypothetical protein F2Q70_00027739 [Brassica cretica]|uniref:Uncharacterized protein n=1 Tax=Brassica cretica TaxID=69181 RepID=A0A8S9L9Y2_BRACR|nr:hypothetical protein F2Q70_00027739 [Brassica cretica]